MFEFKFPAVTQGTRISTRTVSSGRWCHIIICIEDAEQDGCAYAILLPRHPLSYRGGKGLRLSAVRQRLLHCVQVSGLAPTDVAIEFIVAGIDVDPVHDCYFGLPYYLGVTGTLSLSIANLNALNSLVV